MTPELLVKKYPRLYHMAQLGSWPSIRKHGLLSTSALLDQYGVTGKERTVLERVKRPQCVPLSAKGLPGAVLRDQKPMSDGALGKCLQDGLTPENWYALLNAKSFFWLSADRIWRLLGARAYRDTAQTVLTIDTAGVVSAYMKKILLSPINSGSTIMRPMPRGKSTFLSIADFPFEDRAKSRTLPNNVVELVINHSVPDLADYVLAVHEVKNDKVVKEIWRSTSASKSDHP
jgi:hypothetical protein